ncbi:MAG: acyl-CoA thioesterase [Actinomycetota bacterium]
MIFDDGVRLERIGDGRYRGHADERWRVFKGPNGGYLTAMLLNAQILGLGDPERQPRSLAVHFVSRALEGDVEIEVSIERVGRSFSSTTARMFQEGRLCATSHCAFALPRDGDSYDELGMPATAKPDELPDILMPEEMLPPFARNFEYRMSLGNLPYTGSSEAVLGGWIRPKEKRQIDPVLLAAYSDAFPPSVFARLTGPIAAPTIDLTVHFLGDLPLEADWVLCRFESPVARDGVLIEDGWMWSSEGALLARSRQLALYR